MKQQRPEASSPRPEVGGLVTREHVRERLQISEPKLKDLIAKKIIPEPLRLGIRCHRWKVEEIEAALAALRK